MGTSSHKSLADRHMRLGRRWLSSASSPNSRLPLARNRPVWAADRPSGPFVTLTPLGGPRRPPKPPAKYGGAAPPLAAARSGRCVPPPLSAPFLPAPRKAHPFPRGCSRTHPPRCWRARRGWAPSPDAERARCGPLLGCGSHCPAGHACPNRAFPTRPRTQRSPRPGELGRPSLTPFLEGRLDGGQLPASPWMSMRHKRGDAETGARGAATFQRAR